MSANDDCETCDHYELQNREFDVGRCKLTGQVVLSDDGCEHYTGCLNSPESGGREATCYCSTKDPT